MTEPTAIVMGELLEKYGEWTECAAFRFRRHPDDESLVIFEATDDLERITDPEGDDA